MAEYCERCEKEDVLMFANIGGLFGMEPFCLICDDTPPNVVVIVGEEE